MSTQVSSTIPVHSKFLKEKKYTGMFSRQNTELEEKPRSRGNKLKEGKRKANTSIARTRRKMATGSSQPMCHQTCQTRRVKIIRIGDHFVKPIDMENGYERLGTTVGWEPQSWS